MQVQKFESVKVTVDAIQFTDYNWAELKAFAGASIKHAYSPGSLTFIITKEGEMEVSIGDYVVKEPFPTGDRDFYPVKQEIFVKRYRPVGKQSKVMWLVGSVVIAATLILGFVSGIMYAIWYSHQ